MGTVGLNSKHELVEVVLRIIAAAARQSPSGASLAADAAGSTAAPDFVAPQELGGYAVLLLNMMLELYGQRPTQAFRKCWAQCA